MGGFFGPMAGSLLQLQSQVAQKQNQPARKAPDMSGFVNNPQAWMQQSGGNMDQYNQQMQQWQNSQQPQQQPQMGGGMFGSVARAISPQIAQQAQVKNQGQPPQPAPINGLFGGMAGNLLSRFPQQQQQQLNPQILAALSGLLGRGFFGGR